MRHAEVIEHASPAGSEAEGHQTNRSPTHSCGSVDFNNALLAPASQAWEGAAAQVRPRCIPWSCSLGAAAAVQRPLGGGGYACVIQLWPGRHLPTWVPESSAGVLSMILHACALSEACAETGTSVKRVLSIYACACACASAPCCPRSCLHGCVLGPGWLSQYLAAARLWLPGAGPPTSVIPARAALRLLHTHTAGKQQERLCLPKPCAVCCCCCCWFECDSRLRSAQ